MKPCSLLRALPLVALVAAAPALRADDITDAIESARTAYDAGNLSEAIQSLDYAGQLIRQAKGEQVAKLLPDAPAGWTAEDSESDASAAAIMGGMVSAKRTYQRDSGGYVTIQIQSDSPLLQSMAMMFSNPMMITAGGAKLENVKGQKLAVTYRADDKAGDVKAIVDNRYLLTIEGSDLTRDELTAFAKAIDYAKIAALK